MGGSSQTVHSRGITTQETSRQKGSHFLRVEYQDSSFGTLEEPWSAFSRKRFHSPTRNNSKGQVDEDTVLTLSIDFYFPRHVCLSTHVAGYGFHRCTSGRDGAVERSDSGVVHIGTWRDTLRELHYVPEVSLSGAISVQFKAVRNWVSSFLLLRFASNANLKLIVTLSLSFSFLLQVLCPFSTLWLVQSCDYMYVLWNWFCDIWSKSVVKHTSKFDGSCLFIPLLVKNNYAIFLTHQI